MSRLGLSRSTFLTLLVGAIGVVLGRWLQIPGGAFTGALLATTLVRLLEVPMVEPPKWMRSSARIVLGLTIGASVTPDALQAIAQAVLPVLLMVLAMVALSLAVAWVIRRTTHMALPTALCGTVPGALAGMVALADDLGGDARVVASMLLVRLISVLVVIPSLVRVAFPHSAADLATVSATSTAPEALWRLVLLLAIGLVAGTLAVRFKLPAGEILASLTVAAVLCPTWLNLPTLPATWKLFAQWIVGTGVGATVTRATLRDYRPFALAGGLMTAFLITAGLVLGWFLAQVTSIDLVTCLVGSAPGGADNMIILAGELGADGRLVTAMHVSRTVVLMVLVPLISRYVMRRSTSQSTA
jgi:uncharacterized protein